MEVALDPQTKQLMVLQSPGRLSGRTRRASAPATRFSGSTRTAPKECRSATPSALFAHPASPGGRSCSPVLHEGEEKPTEITIVRGTIQVDSVRGDTRRPDGSWNFFLEGPSTNRLRPHYEFHRQDGRRNAPGARVALGARTMRARTWCLDLRRSAGGIRHRGGRRLRPVIPSGVIVTVRRRRRSHQSDARRQRPSPVYRLPRGRVNQRPHRQRGRDRGRLSPGSPPRDGFWWGAPTARAPSRR